MAEVIEKCRIHCNDEVQKILDECGVGNPIKVTIHYDDSYSQVIGAGRIGYYLDIQYYKKDNCRR